MALRAILAALILVCCEATLPKRCPEKSKSRSNALPNLRGRAEGVSVDVVNRLDEQLLSVWVDFDGNETILARAETMMYSRLNTFPGHLLRFYTQKDGLPLAMQREYRVPATYEDVQIFVDPCGDSKAGTINVTSSRAEEFELLSLPEDAPCDLATDSSRWSCVRFLSIEDVAKRDPEQYGLHAGEGVDGKDTHDTVDTAYVKQIGEIPQVTPFGPGYKRMKFSQALFGAKAWWDNLDPVEKQGKPEILSGGFTNDGTKLTILDNYENVQKVISNEMKDILQWWTGLRLAHSATYGVRTYRRDNVLVDHVDRAEDRIVCGVMQMSQNPDNNSGWPLEVLLPNGTIGEIYMQPGELLLLESAWLMHGRPMRFRGTNYSVVMAHFRPVDWDHTMKLKGNRYYGVPKGRLTTLADKGYVKSDSFSWPSAVWDFASASLTRLWETCSS